MLSLLSPSYSQPGQALIAFVLAVAYRQQRPFGPCHLGNADIGITKVCGACPLKEHCLPPSKTYQRLVRWEHETVMDRHRQRMATGEGVMRQRGSLVEHPFGTLKCWAGINYFLMRGLSKCRGELNLMTLCYNFKRVLTAIKVQAFIAYCQVRMAVQGSSV